MERDLLYTGHPVMERCSVVSRIAPSFLRFGSFEIFKPYDPSTGARLPSSTRTSALLCVTMEERQFLALIRWCMLTCVIVSRCIAL